jgi:uncharacterized lipoprotein YehR (DUF1307 family)
MKKIKSVLLITFLAVVIFATSTCGKEGIVGKWKYESADYTYTFNEDGTGDYNGMKFTYTTDVDKISILYDGNTAAFESTFTIDGNKLNIKDSYGNDTIYIRQ